MGRALASPCMGPLTSSFSMAVGRGDSSLQFALSFVKVKAGQSVALFDGAGEGVISPSRDEVAVVAEAYIWW